MNTCTLSHGILAVIFSINILLFPATAVAAEFVVDTSLDEVDALPGDGVCASFSGACTLRAAVMEANALPGSDFVRVTTDVDLTIPANPLYDEEYDDRISDLDITDDLIIAGDDEYLPIIRNSAPIFSGDRRIFHVVSPVHVEMTSLIIERGDVPTGLISGAGGAAIRNDEGIVSLFGLILRGNTADFGGALFNAGTLEIRDSLLTQNQNIAAVSGSAIYNEGRLYVIRTRIEDNVGEDGAISTKIGAVTFIVDSTITRNWQENGGGIYNRGEMTIHRSTISDNEATSSTGAIFNDSGGVLTIRNSTISGNVAYIRGGIDNRGTLLVINSTITDNTDTDGSTVGGIDNAGTAFVQSSIIAGNDAGQALPRFPDCFGAFISLGHNLIGDLGDGDDNSSCSGFDDPTDRVGTSVTPIDPLLGPLADNGGYTRTHALLPESPAIDAIRFRDCVFDHDGDPETRPRRLGTDQRLISRRQGHGCDIGAYELVKEENWATE